VGWQGSSAGRTPARLALRPLELKQLFDFALRLYRLNFVPILLLTLLLHAPLAAISTVVSFHLIELAQGLQEAANTPAFDDPLEFFAQQNPEGWLLLGGLTVLALIYQLLVLPLVQVAASRLATCTLYGTRCTAAEAIAYARARYWGTQVALATFFLPLVLLAVLVLLPVLLLWSGTGATGDPAGVLASAFGGLFFIFLGGFATWLMYFRYFPALSGALQAGEPAPPLSGAGPQGLWYLKRAYALTERYFWRMLGLLVLFFFVTGFIQRGVQESINLIVWLIWLPFHWPQGEDAWIAVMESSSDPTVTAITLVVASLFALLLPGLQTCLQVLLYQDLRFRREGLDLQLVLEQEEAAAPAPVPSAG
jgi:hypothetical protein